VPKITISYRRADTEVMTGRIRDRLANHYGEDAVFMDIDNIPDFRVHISETIAQSDVLLVIVGRGWLGARSGNKRIDDETDFVRLEVETALSNAIPIIPVLVGSARMPQPVQLRESLKNFAFLNAAPVDTGRDFHQHMERLIRSIDQTLADQRVQSSATLRSPDEMAAQVDLGSRVQLADSNATAESPIGQELGSPIDDLVLRRDPETLPTADQTSDANMPDLSVFRDAPFAPELVAMRAGEFMMGSTEEEEGGYQDERPQHCVAIGQRFALGRHPVTFDEYDRFCEAEQREKPDDKGWGRGRRPVINVSRQDAKDYISWLSQGTGEAYRLPSEAEWEYACRAGTASRYSFGEEITPDRANYADARLGCPSEVGAYPANPWGLHDRHGNVWEWIEDDWHGNYRGAPPNGSAWKETGLKTRAVMCCAAAPG
jgi:formylglycine-generating enzyme required for sulfatase activity